MSTNKKIFSLLLFSFLLPFAVNSEQKDNQVVPLSVTCRPAGRSDSQMDLRDIINSTLALEFKIRGYEAQIVEAQNRTGFLEESEEQGALYGLECLYDIKGKLLYTDVYLLRIDGQEEVFFQSLSLIINLELDFSLGSTLDAMVLALEKDLREHPPKQDVMIDRAVKENPVTPEDATPFSAAEQKPLKPFKISLGAAPFLTTGESALYFSLRPIWQIYGGYQFDLPMGYGAVGLYNSVYFFDAQGSKNQESGSFISVGPEIRLGIEGDSLLGMYFRFSGGGTLFFLEREGSVGATLIPCFSAGWGGEINFSSFLGMYLEGNYTFYLERSLFVSGFCPTVGFQFKI